MNAYYTNTSAMQTIPSNNLPWSSLFIPSVPSDVHDEYRLTVLLEHYFNIGKIRRIDFIQKKGHENKYMAFVHFDYWNNTIPVNKIRYHIENFEYLNLLYNNNSVVRIAINKNPIKETELNAHQLANELELSNKTISEKNTEIEVLKLQIEVLNKENLVLNNKINLLFNVNDNINFNTCILSDKEEEDPYIFDINNIPPFPNKLTRQTNEPINIIHLINIKLDDIIKYTDESSNEIIEVNEYYNTCNMSNIEEYIKQINLLLFNMLNINNFKRTNDIHKVSIIYIKDNIFTIKFTTYNNAHTLTSIKQFLYLYIIKYIENTLSINYLQKTYTFKPTLIGNISI